MNFPAPVIEIAIEPKSKADQEKLGVALAKLVAEDPSFTVSDRPGVGPDDPEGHGRAAPRHQGRHPEAAPTRSTPTSARRRWPTARASAARPRSTTPTRSRPAVRASSPASRSSSSRASRARASCSRSPIVGGTVPKEYIPGVAEGPRVRQGQRPAGRLPADRLQGDPDRRRLPRRRLHRAGLRNRRPRRLPRTAGKGRAQAARADHEGRGRDPRGLPGLGHRRPEQPSRPDPGQDMRGNATGRQRLRAAGQHVRLREHAARHVARAAPSSPCSTTTTSRCRNTSPTK